MADTLRAQIAAGLVRMDDDRVYGMYASHASNGSRVIVQPTPTSSRSTLYRLFYLSSAVTILSILSFFPPCPIISYRIPSYTQYMSLKTCVQ